MSLDVALRDRADATLIEVSPERGFRARVEASRNVAPLPSGYVIPDGGFTLRKGNGQPRSFYLEVVRADVRGGNATLRAKLAKYVELNRTGALRALYGHDRLRAVLFLTTSPERAERLRALATALPHGRRLFWFGAYGAPGPGGRLVPALSSTSVLDRRWTDADGARVGFLDEAAVPNGHGPAGR